MKRVKETKLKLTTNGANIVGHLGYATFKFWNVLRNCAQITDTFIL